MLIYFFALENLVNLVICSQNGTSGNQRLNKDFIVINGVIDADYSGVLVLNIRTIKQIDTENILQKSQCVCIVVCHRYAVPIFKDNCGNVKFDEDLILTEENRNEKGFGSHGIN